MEIISYDEFWIKTHAEVESVSCCTSLYISGFRSNDFFKGIFDLKNILYEI